jgi:hypothetical protein
VTEFTATAGQTTFSVPSYTVGYLNVFQNGVRLGAADFTATNGTTVVLASAAAAGDLITTESFYVSSVLNAIPATAGSVQQTYLAPNVAGNGPAFSYYASGTTSVPTATFTKVVFAASEFDTTGGMVSANRFTPTVAGYYYITGSVYLQASSESFATIYKNGAEWKRGTDHGSLVYAKTVSGLIYMNGSTDYVEIYTYQASGSTQTVSPNQAQTYFQGFMARAA